MIGSLTSSQSGAIAGLLFCLVVALLFGVIGRACAAGRNRGGAGFWLGFMLGPLGCVIALFLPATPSRRYRGSSWR